MVFTTIDFRSLLPVLYFFISSTSFLFSVQLSKRSRLLSAPFIYGFAIFSLQTSIHLSWVYHGAASYWNLMIWIWMHHASSVLFIEAFQFPCVPMSKQGWTLAYKIWADPQNQLDWSTYMQPCDRTTVRARTYITFFLRRTAKLVLCWCIEFQIINPIINSYFQFTAEDFAPKYEPFIRRIIKPDYDAPIDSRGLQIRAIISVYWIWLAYLLLDGANVLLSLLFVCLLRFDKPTEWKSLFGSISSASSLRRFWGKLWHRLASPSCASSGRLLTRSFLRLRPHSGGEKIVIAFWTFLVSGIIHTASEWQAGEPVFPWKQLQFWLTNFAIATLETYVVRKKGYGPGSVSKNSRNALQTMYQILGYIWVFIFFFWVAPKWQYPKLRAALTPDRSPLYDEQPNPFLELLLSEHSDHSID